MDPVVAWQSHPKFQDRGWLHVLLFMLTLASTTLVGAMHYAGYLDDFAGSTELPMPFAALYLRGLWFSGTILAILGCHELGHYLACRYYDVDASLPFFLPMPIVFSGTLGAFIRIREPFPNKRVLFDIGIAGPLAGFLVAVPALFIGLGMSHVVRIPPNMPLDELGEPLVFKLASWVFWGTPPDGYAVNMHPIAFAAWFGLLATALNLFPFAQLDGGHIAYAVLGQRSSYVSFLTLGVAACLALVFVSPAWVVWIVLMLVLLRLVGIRHPPVPDEDVPLDRARLVLAVVALIILVLCFMPDPIRHVTVIGR